MKASTMNRQHLLTVVYGFLAAAGLVLVGAVPCVAKEKTATEGKVSLDTELVLDRYRQILLRESIPDTDTLRNYVKEMSSDGTWPDIDYTNPQPSGWTVLDHWKRLRQLSQALVTEGHPLHNDSTVRSAVNRGLDHWLAKRYQSSNWWYNNISVPRYAADVAILLGDELQGSRREGVLEIVEQYDGMKGSAANLVWRAEVAFHYACLTHDPANASVASNRIWQEIKVGSPQGSFFQHGPHLEVFQYGKPFFGTAAKLSWQLRDTDWAIPEEKRAILSNYVLEGCQWMCRGIHTSPGTVDRSISRKGSLNFADLHHELRYWRDVDLDHRVEIDAFLTRQRRGFAAAPLVGFRHFPRADFTVYHRPLGSVFLKTLSSRTLPSESINQENLKGVPFLGCGDHYVVRDGSEYAGLQPMFRWDRLPGLTLADRETRQKRLDFVGGVGNGQSGMTAMDYVRQADEKDALAVHKAWFFHADQFVCLLGGWTGSDSADGRLVTSIEQCRLRGPVIVGTAREDDSDGGKTSDEQASTKTLKRGVHHLGKGDWLLHEGVGYLPINASFTARLEDTKGSWYAINHRYNSAADRENVSEPVLRIELEHPAKPTPAGFAVFLGADRDLLASAAAKPAWTIVRNDRQCQSLCFDDGLGMAAFYESTSVEVRPEPHSSRGPTRKDRSTASSRLTVYRPCLAMWTDDTLWLVDPTNRGASLTAVWRGKQRHVELPPGGTAVAMRREPAP